MLRNLWWKIFPLERKKNEQIKGLISKMWLFFCYTIQLITINPCTKFQNPNPSSCWEIFDEKKVYRQTDRQTNIITEKAKTIYPLYTSYRGHLWQKFPLERKKNEQIKGLISNMWLFFSYTIQLITIKLCTKFQNPNPSSCWEIFDKKKFTDKQLQTDRQT